MNMQKSSEKHSYRMHQQWFFIDFHLLRNTHCKIFSN